MVKRIWLEIMKIVGTLENQETADLKQVDVQLRIDEIDNLIKFLFECKNSFIKRKQDCSIQKVNLKDESIILERIESYKKVKEMGCEVLDCHLHYNDYNFNKIILDNVVDLVVHTLLIAKEEEGDVFSWENKE